jgi:hypothetical protein
MGTSSKSGADISLPRSLTFKIISLQVSGPPNSSLRIIYWFIYFEGRSKWPRGLRRWSAGFRLLVLRVRIPPGTWMSVSCVFHYRVEISTICRSLFQRSSTGFVCLCMIVKPWWWGGSGPLGSVAQWGKNCFESNTSSKTCCQSVNGNSVIRVSTILIEDCRVQCIRRLTLILGIPVFEGFSGSSVKKISE